VGREFTGLDARPEDVDERLAAAGAVGVEEVRDLGVVLGGFDEGRDARRQQRLREGRCQVVEEALDLLASGAGGGIEVGTGLLVQRFQCVGDQLQLGRPVPVDGASGDPRRLCDGLDRCGTRVPGLAPRPCG
jgi:hypothetical protein